MGVDLPTVDLNVFSTSPDWRRKEEATKLTDSLINHGFVKIVNHSIPNEVVRGIFQWASVP